MFLQEKIFLGNLNGHGIHSKVWQILQRWLILSDLAILVCHSPEPPNGLSSFILYAFL